MTLRALNKRTNRLVSLVPITANKDHRCEQCGLPILRGDTYFYVTSMYPFRVCTSCGEEAANRVPKGVTAMTSETTVTTVVTCDQCQATASGDPPAWLSARLGTEWFDFRPVLHFCSYKCLARWALGKAK